ncbi:MAG: hypothetical protein WDZ94_02975 [Patescibacteria group bacterium]
MSTHQSSEDSANSLRELTDTIEARQAQKERKGIEKRKKDAAKKRQQLLERMVAPTVLLLTVITAYVLWMLA